MSTILKALRRLEQEKASSGRPLREQVTGGDGGGGEPPRRRWPILVGGILAGVAAGLGVLFFTTRRDAGAPEASEAAPAEAQAQAKAPPRAAQPGRRPAAPIPAKARRAAPIRPAANVEDVAVVPRQPARPRIAKEDLPAPAAEPDADASPDAMPPGARPGAESPAPGASAAAPQRIAIAAPPAQRPAPRAPAPAPVAEARVAPPSPPPAPRPAPVAAEPAPRPVAAAASAPAKPVAPAPKPVAKPAATAAPAQTAKAAPPDALPPLHVERTLWHPLAEKRIVVIELPGGEPQEFHEGAEVLPGARISVIEPSGVVFLVDGRLVRRKVGAQ